jgi:hypothetical protein
MDCKIMTRLVREKERKEESITSSVFEIKDLKSSVVFSVHLILLGLKQNLVLRGESQLQI